MGQENVTLSKITPPVLLDTIPRRRLFRFIDASCRKQNIIWICGPPGSGKTTLAAGYIRNRKLPCLWYRIDEQDADPGSFFHYLGLAARRVAPRRRIPLPHFTREYLSNLSIFTKSWFEALCRRFPIPSVVVFDDCQNLPPDSPLHQAIVGALEQVLPEKGIGIFLISRDKPLPVTARLRSKGLLNSINWKDLRLTVEESLRIARLRMAGGQRVSRERIEKIHEKTLGWAAGLVLMLEKKGPDEEIPDDLSMTGFLAPAAVFDYFSNELFRGLEEETQDFLLKTSFLHQIKDDTAMRLTGNRSASLLLAELARKNCFTFEYESSSDAVTYSYHPLLRDFLQEEAKRRFTQEELNGVKRSTAAVLREAGDIESAIELLRETGDGDDLSAMIIGQALSLMAQGRYQTLERWIRGIPEDHRVREPWILYWHGASRTPFNLSEARGWFERAFPLFEEWDDPAGLFLTWSGIVDTIAYEWADFILLDRWLAVLRNLMERYPEFPSPEVSGNMTKSIFCALMLRRPHAPEIAEWERRLVSVIQDNSSADYRILIAYPLIYYHLWVSGDHARGGMIFEMVRPVSPKEVSPLALIAWHVIEASWYGMTNRGEDCRKAIDMGFKVARETGIHTYDFMLSMNQISLCLCMGQISAAKRHLKELSAIIDRTQRLNLSHYHYLASWAEWLEGNHGVALEHARRSVEIAERLGGPFPLATTLNALAQVLYSSGMGGKAAAALSKSLQISGKMNGKLLLCRGLLLKSAMELEKGQAGACVRTLRKALSIGREQNYLIFSWWDRQMMTRLCTRALEEGIEVDYVQSLIRERGLAIDPIALNIEGWPWRLKIATLGRFEVIKDESPIPLTGKTHKKPLEMLKVIIALGGRNVRNGRSARPSGRRPMRGPDIRPLPHSSPVCAA